MLQDKVAVLISTFNGEKYLEEFLFSLDNQQCPGISLFVGDDGSSDATLQILNKFQSASKYPFQIIPSKGRLGAAAGFFELLAVAGGDFDYYAFGDQDDVWMPDKISRAVNELNKASREIPSLYCSRLEVVDKELNHLRWSRIPRRIGFGNAIVENVATGCTLVMNASAREFILSALPDNCLMHDWWCYLTICCFGQIIFDENPGIKYRLHDTNVVGVATTTMDNLNRRVNRFFKSEDGVFRFSDQVSEFIEDFGDRIPSQQFKILDLVVSGKTSFLDRIRLVLSRDIWRQRWSDDLILRILILINHF